VPRKKPEPVIPEPDLWERQPREPDRAWDAFRIYRDLGPDQRSLNRVRSEIGKAYSNVSEWSGRWEWVKRCRAWDAFVDEQKRLEFIREAKEMGRRQAIEASAMQRTLMQPVRKFLTRVQQAGDEEFDDLSLVELWQLSAAATKLYPLVAKLEHYARGVGIEQLVAAAQSAQHELDPALTRRRDSSPRRGRSSRRAT
jgi:hypothetical protein